MPYELHIDKSHVATCATLEEAQTHARGILLNRPDAEVEILDPRTKRAVEPASSTRWRDELSNKIGY
jgi:hypothetical protein